MADNAGPDAVVLVDAHLHRHHSLSNTQAQSSNPPAPNSPQHSPRGHPQTAISHYAGDQISPTYSSSGSSAGRHYTTSSAMQDHFEMPPAKRQRISDAKVTLGPTGVTTAATQSPEHQGIMNEPPPSQLRGSSTCQRQKAADSRRESDAHEQGPPRASPTTSKPRRVRTGCLTCRNRHLKCDEAIPICLNCQKSNRKCERGVRLNFIDLKVEQPPYLLPPVDWKGEYPSADLFPSEPWGSVTVSRLGLPYLSGRVDFGSQDPDIGT